MNVTFKKITRSCDSVLNRTIVTTICRCLKNCDNHVNEDGIKQKHTVSFRSPVDKRSEKSSVDCEKTIADSSNYSWDLLRSLSSSWRWGDSKTTKINGNNLQSSLEVKDVVAAPVSLQPVKKVEDEIGSNSKNEVEGAKSTKFTTTSHKITNVILNSISEGSESSGQIVSRLMETSSMISKVAQLNILNEKLARHPHLLSLSQRNVVAKHLISSKEIYRAKVYQEAVRCTMNLLGMPAKPKGDGIKVLSIDGGGTRGLAPLEMLYYLEQEAKKKGAINIDNPDTSKSFISQFDLVCGVSTGSVVAFMVAVAGLSFERSIVLYRKMAGEIFQRSSFLGVSSTLTGNAWYDTDKWTKHLQSYEKSFDPVFTASREENSPMVCAVSAITSGEILRPLVFRSYGFPPDSSSRYHGDSSAENWQVLRASTAAPFYFDSFPYGNVILQDGGIILNNPTALAVHEARALWPNEKLQLVLSLGTGLQNSIPKGSSYSPNGANIQNPFSAVGYGSKADKVKTEILKTVNHFIDSVTDTEIVHTTLKDLLPKGTYFRFNPRLNDSFVLDEFRAEKLNALREQTLNYMTCHHDRVERFIEAYRKPRSRSSKLKDMWNENSDKIFPKAKQK